MGAGRAHAADGSATQPIGENPAGAGETFVHCPNGLRASKVAGGAGGKMKDRSMKTLLSFAAFALAVSAATTSADAKGCLTGAVAGGVAGHYVHHTLTGAIAGCYMGRKIARQKQQQRQQQAAPAQKAEPGAEPSAGGGGRNY